jgi:hypothetical protein
MQRQADRYAALGAAPPAEWDDADADEGAWPAP